jgi:cytochrome b pre-mRNA-processing protein 3
MISLPFRRARRTPNIDALYGMIVAQARSEVFYRDYGVPDTVEGRLDMIVLHLVLVLRRLADGQTQWPPTGQQIFDRFCRDIDDNFREMGVGDLAVPKQMQRVASAFFGRAKAYGAALDHGEGRSLDEIVARNVFGVADPPLGAGRLAAYMKEAAQRLDRQPIEAVTDQGPDFVDPAAVPAPTRSS